MMMRFLLRVVIVALGLWLATELVSGIRIATPGSLLIAAVLLGVCNALVRPILVILTLPVTLLTLGLFLFVINALLFWLVANVVQGFAVSGFFAALIGSLLYSVITLLTSWILFGAKRS